MPDHYDSLETRDPAQRAREEAAALPGIVSRAMSAPGWARQLAGIDAKSVTSRAALAKLPVLRKADLAALQKESPPFGGLNVTPANRARRLLMSPGPIFEPEGDGSRLVGRGARLLCRRLPARRHRAQFVRLSSHARRLHSGVGRASARLRGDPGRRRQYRAAARGDRALQAVRLRRHAGFSQDPARHRREDRQGRDFDQARAGVGRGAAGFAARGTRKSAASPCCNAMPPPSLA